MTVDLGFLLSKTHDFLEIPVLKNCHIPEVWRKQDMVKIGVVYRCDVKNKCDSRVWGGGEWSSWVFLWGVDVVKLRTRYSVISFGVIRLWYVPPGWKQTDCSDYQFERRSIEKYIGSHWVLEQHERVKPAEWAFMGPMQRVKWVLALTICGETNTLPSCTHIIPSSEEKLPRLSLSLLSEVNESHFNM